MQTHFGLDRSLGNLNCILNSIILTAQTDSTNAKCSTHSYALGGVRPSQTFPAGWLDDGPVGTTQD